MTIPFSPKLRLAPLWPAAAALVAVAALVLALVPGTLARGAAEELQATLRLLSPALPLPEPGRARPDAGIQRRVTALAEETSYRITIIAIEGTVVADSERTPAQLAEMDNHLSRPEVAEALARGEGRAIRRSETTGVETAYAARLVHDANGGAAIVRLGLPIASLASLRRSLTGALLLSAALAAALVALLSWWLTRSLFRPLSALIATAHRMGEGDYRARPAVPEQGELATLGRALERIAANARGQIAAVEAERDHLRATVASMTEGVLVADRHGRGQLVNPAFRDLFGLPAQSAPEEVLGLAREARLDDLIAATLASHRAASAELERLEPAARTLALFASPLEPDGGVVVVARDITEAERLTRMRKDFVANVSHELKTPLAAIRGYAETLVDGAAEERTTALRFSERILDQCRRLGDLLEDLLTLSRLEGTQPFRALERVDLRELAHEAAELVGAAAAARSIAVVVEAGGVPAVVGDPDGLLRLLANLLDNAVKYNRESGAVTVRLREQGEHAVLEVADTGIGIAPAHLARIFERFYRVDRGRARDEGGTGLGLAIVKHVAQAHQGRVEVESEPGVGSTFRVLLPRASGPAS
ncbi:MAG: multi-sensor signal transduction histidine kinase [Acidobacteria bacterium]|nr:multi-sensor signal transduction histidine kinase [Acidobacteriota bacterium]